MQQSTTLLIALVQLSERTLYTQPLHPGAYVWIRNSYEPPLAWPIALIVTNLRNGLITRSRRKSYEWPGQSVHLAHTIGDVPPRKYSAFVL